MNSGGGFNFEFPSLIYYLKYYYYYFTFPLPPEGYRGPYLSESSPVVKSLSEIFMSKPHEAEILARILAGKIRLNGTTVEYLCPNTKRWKRKNPQYVQGRDKYVFRLSNRRVAGVYANRLLWMLSSQEEIPEGFNVDHIDGNPTNDRVENLRLHAAGESSSQGNDRLVETKLEALGRWFRFVGEYGREPLTDHEVLYVETGF